MELPPFTYSHFHIPPLQLDIDQLLQVFDDLPACIRTGCARDSSTRMCTRATKIQAMNRSSVLSPAEERPKSKELIERMFPMKDVAAGQAVSPLQIERRQHLASGNGIADLRRVVGKRFDNGVAQLMTARTPIAAFQLIRRVLNVNRHNMGAGGCKGRVHQRRNGDVQIRLRRKITVFGRIERLLQVICVGTDVNSAGQIPGSIPDASERRKS